LVDSNGKQIPVTLESNRDIHCMLEWIRRGKIGPDVSIRIRPRLNSVDQWIVMGYIEIDYTLACNALAAYKYHRK